MQGCRRVCTLCLPPRGLTGSIAAATTDAAVVIQCCAIDYMVHTLDGTACLLNNNRIFPSR